MRKQPSAIGTQSVCHICIVGSDHVASEGAWSKFRLCCRVIKQHRQFAALISFPILNLIRLTRRWSPSLPSGTLLRHSSMLRTLTAGSRLLRSSQLHQLANELDFRSVSGDLDLQMGLAAAGGTGVAVAAAGQAPAGSPRGLVSCCMSYHSNEERMWIVQAF